MCNSNDTQVFEKKLNGYGESDNFVAPRELTVTITLSEYRSLVMAKRSYDKSIEDLRTMYYKMEHRVQTLVDKLNRSKNDNKPEAEKCKDE